jgi:hypothetical protein
LGSGVNDIDFVEGDGMDNFLSLLKFTFWALDVSGLWPGVVIITASGEGLSEFGDLAGGFVDCDDVTGHNLFLLD